MYDEIRTETGRDDLAILGVNDTGYEGGNDLILVGRDIPFLQDNATVGAWALWQAEYRDVFILDGENRPVGLLNLTTHDLALAENYELLKGMILSAMGE